MEISFPEDSLTFYNNDRSLKEMNMTKTIVGKMSQSKSFYIKKYGN